MNKNDFDIINRTIDGSGKNFYVYTVQPDVDL